MTHEQCYYITKSGKEGEAIFLDHEQLENGFNITPKNQLSYGGIAVQKLVIIKPSFIEKVLKRKIQKKLELYLNYIIDVIDSDDPDDGGGLNEILGELSRYQDILKYRYQKYLGEKYIELMNKKIEVLEYELKLKAMKYQNTFSYEEEMTDTKSR